MNLAKSGGGVLSSSNTFCRILAYTAVLVVFLFPSFVISPAWAYRSVIVVDHKTGKVLKSHNPDVTHPPASLTKMMTLYLLFEAVDKGKFKLSSRLRVSRRAQRTRPSKIYLKAGQTITVRQAIFAIAVRSANDAARVVAEALAGSEAKFAYRMTRKARQLGMKRTVFRNSSGLPDRSQRTTARDIAILARALLRDFPHHYHYFSTRHFSYGRRTFRNTNHLLGSYRGVDGIKTGYTRRARYNLATSAVRGKKRLITVVLGARSSSRRFAQTRNLLDASWGGAQARDVLVAERKPAPAKKQDKPAVVAGPEKPKPAIVEIKPDATVAARPGTVDAVKPAPRVSVRTEPLDPFVVPKRDKSAPEAAGNFATLADGARDYAIRVGVFKTEAEAHAAAVVTAWALPKPYRDGAKVDVGTSWFGTEKRYTARLIKLTQAQATGSCNLLSDKGKDCLASPYREPATVVANRNTATPTPPQRSATENSPRLKASDRKATRKSKRTASRKSRRLRGRYAIQVGAHKRYRTARRSVRTAYRKLPRRLKKGLRVRVVKPSGRLYRGRLVGLTRVKARKACKVLRRKGTRCMAIKAAARKRGRYAIQVGALKRYKKARRIMRKAYRKLPSRFKRAIRARVVDRKGEIYRARLVGLTRVEAKKACKVLRRKGTRCLAILHDV